MDNTKLNEFWTEWGKSFENALPFWRSWDAIARYQKDIWDNYAKMFPYSGFSNSLLQPAPAKLWQSILRGWSFSLINITDELKGNSEMEYDIITNVAGYGSQLGTIMDFLDLLEEKYKINPQKMKNPDEAAIKYYAFKDLIEKIKMVKGSE